MCLFATRDSVCVRVRACTHIDSSRAHARARAHRIWDLALARNVEVSPAVRLAMQRLHQRGKGKVPEGTLKLPDIGGNRLKASRRLHKICMGPVRGSK